MNVQELLAMFCTAKDFKYALSKPFRVGDYVYATDGRGAIRLPADMLPDAATEGKFPPVLDLPWGVTGKVEHPIPSAISAQVVPCESCRGDGTQHEKECPECYGVGDVECSQCGHMAMCDRCYGRGTVSGDRKSPCIQCDGTGEKVNDVARRIGDKTYFYERMLRRARAADAETIWIGKPDAPAYFRAGKVEGLIMPANSDMAKELGYPAVIVDGKAFEVATA